MDFHLPRRARSSRILPLAIASALTIAACGGGGGRESVLPTAPESPPTTPSTPTTPTTPSTPTTPVPPPAEQPQTCINTIHGVNSVIDDGNFELNFSPSNAIDGDSQSASRWSSDGPFKELVLDLGNIKTVGALTIKWYKGADRISNFSVETSTDNSTWLPVLVQGESSGRHSGFELVQLDESEGRYVKIIADGNSVDDNNGIIEVEVHSCSEATGQFSNKFPNELGIELVDWYLSVPTDEDNSGTADSISETELAAGYTNSEYFYASADNGIVMRSPSYGFKTSQNTNYVRVELREMLRRGDRSISTKGVNKNNWVFGSAPQSAQDDAGGVDGDLHVTLAVNQVTTTGENYQIGRVIIGQIHANDDEPVRLYYRKLPGNALGSIYFAHESRVEGSDEAYVELIGSRSNSASNPTDGIALDEKFSYHINVDVNLLTVTISREGKPDVVGNFDMSDSLYDDPSQYQYFKVGVYHVNNSSDPEEYAQATFYEIRNGHTGYGASE
ncbi:polysaccharide lyase family 7 protein [Aliiglaciecola sp. M165]|uniref:polysaccharide lyase family 7 protein n=1 Tax=Aliiglaciecola sp. M165 TaxID=2593649 RepID=UPI001181153F|nr:polysaccharide lyase family 7 protein [Aliiglaciecola sp. M165]TRY33152.1 cyclic nucleotide-binding protein [Aliiglaciecola sp. M165]